MFGFLSDIIKGVGNTVVTITGSVVGLSVNTIANTLKLSEDAIQSALDAGCTTYEDIKKFHNL